MMIKIFDSVKREKVEFIPLKKGEVSLYVCGPTVYDDSHLGHARSAIAFDLLRRLMEFEGYRVRFVKNFTDIDDKIIKKSLESGEEIGAITERYITSYLEDMQKLGIKRPDIEPRATESLDLMWEMIQSLLQKGIAYQTSRGDIYLDVKQDPSYGKLSGRGEDLEQVSRIESSEEKRDPRDFALWKSYKGQSDVGYESPFGRGRPGWHIECSAMIEKHLAKEGDYAIDIHAGGSDLLFPHHENEACQTRCATGRELAKYWMHNGFVTINGEKMSKSLGNSFFVKDALRVYDGEVLRFYLLSTHYRMGLNFSEEDLLASKKRLDRLYRLKKRVGEGEVGAPSEKFLERLLEGLRDDMNISRALSAMDEMLTLSNEELDSSPKERALQATIRGNLGVLERLLGIGAKSPILYFQMGVSPEEKEKIEELIKERAEAKKAKDFVRADEIRKSLSDRGIALLDTPSGTIWERA
ncbi:MAG: cysteine--tRNA ligase [Wolinella succinogenes]|uniref:cysteine--tRNA ligase n=1 Tax=Wolinella succinogenes TaxID=844 RepID=UPI0016B5E1CC|nr:cysteine--tRNA ligase [Wolinella succinogenes]NLU34578.1 cysteine--tRNA ligase [Wolinella succinogenes]